MMLQKNNKTIDESFQTEMRQKQSWILSEKTLKKIEINALICELHKKIMEYVEMKDRLSARLLEKTWHEH